mmetsp:Transcript_18256/g.33930  ORF Transcript_18256/g.33930 Transcript_18256/m.33930 type:complete len:90 (-) Transcript_18256:2-271(-)
MVNQKRFWDGSFFNDVALFLRKLPTFSFGVSDPEGGGGASSGMKANVKGVGLGTGDLADVSLPLLLLLLLPVLGLFPPRLLKSPDGEFI